MLTARPSYAKWKSVLSALKARPDVELQIVVAASANLERYGRVRDVLERDGHTITVECWTVLEGATLLTGARETGLAMMDLASTYHQLNPDVVCVMADRREILAAAAAATFQGIRVAHMQGGESSGSVDNVVRNAVTALADYHFPSTERAARRVSNLTDASDRVWNFGCPSLDIAKQAQGEPPVTVEELGGAGADIDLSRPFGVLLQHPVTSEADQAGTQMVQTLRAWPPSLPCVAFWPGQDAGQELAAKQIRLAHAHIHTVRNLAPSRFLQLLIQASVLVGNSSAGIRECSYLGVPVVNCGSRQTGRERGPNVLDVPHDADAIHAAIERQIAHGPYPSSALYGTGTAGERIAEVLACLC